MPPLDPTRDPDSDADRRNPVDGDERADDVGATSLHARRARDGDAASIEWLVRRLSPLLVSNARYRIGRRLRGLYDPEDLVQDVWVVALGRLAELPTRDGRFTPVLLKFLSTTLLYRVNNLVSKHIRGKPGRLEESDESDPLAGLADARTGLVSRVLRAERRDAVTIALERLEERDREIIVLRGIEGQPYRDIALVHGGEPKSLAVRYQRALAKLRDALPGSVFDELTPE